MAPKTAGNKQKAPSKAKMPPKKQKIEEEEEEEVFDEEELVDDDDDFEAEEEEAGAEEAGDAPAANTRRKATGTATRKKGGRKAASSGLPQITINDVLLGDHRDTVALLKHFEEVSKSGDKMMLEKLTDAIAITIRLHSQAEFEVLYPLLEKKLGSQGKELNDQAMKEHSQIEEDLLKALEMRKEGNKELTKTLKEVMELFIQHLGEEEDEMMPMLMEKMSEDEQVELALSFQQAKIKAPLEPQPVEV